MIGFKKVLAYSYLGFVASILLLAIFNSAPLHIFLAFSFIETVLGIILFFSWKWLKFEFPTLYLGVCAGFVAIAPAMFYIFCLPGSSAVLTLLFPIASALLFYYASPADKKRIQEREANVPIFLPVEVGLSVESFADVCNTIIRKTRPSMRDAYTVKIGITSVERHRKGDLAVAEDIERNLVSDPEYIACSVFFHIENNLPVNIHNMVPGAQIRGWGTTSTFLYFSGKVLVSDSSFPNGISVVDKDFFEYQLNKFLKNCPDITAPAELGAQEDGIFVTLHVKPRETGTSVNQSPFNSINPDSFFKKMCICAIVAAIILVGVYICNHLLPQGNGGNTGNGYQIDYHTPYIHWEPTPTPSPTPKRTPTPTPTRTPTKKSSSIIGQYCRINDPGANVRSGPSTNYNKIGLAPNNNWYIIVDYDRENTSKDWYKINMDGTYCWIYSELVELDGNTNGTTDGKPVSSSNSNSSNSNTVSIIGETCYIFDDGNNVRTGPGTNYSIIGQVNSGASFKIYDYEICTTGKKPRDWYKIYFNGQYGWISSGIVDLHGHRDGTAYGVRVYD
ncbi:MAG: SH3 domain-containing protein [Oscillospiraceae bacterium]|nr:SH3 domain-containing protein [Clostridia bacterium]MBQ8620653.1 SH3 domain-containing protein [Clostridia bacterium]MBQ9167506.1 SH3 domain-containing protein [Oscillospiraceae bacterium]